ncbi:hypothetical protein HK405_010044 [Cladochytrium tenue]|nr:hypothetical protein HK405_010044 [Cladochytrium tenue]
MDTATPYAVAEDPPPPPAPSTTTTTTTATASSAILSRLRPLRSQAARSLAVAMQYARERLARRSPGGGDDADTAVTELPEKFRALEDRVDRVRRLLTALTRVSRNYVRPRYDYDPPLADSARGIASAMSGRVQSIVASYRNPAMGVPTPGTDGSGGDSGINDAAAAASGSPVPSGLSDAFSRAAAAASASGLAEDNAALAAALGRFAEAHGRVASARLRQDAAAAAGFHRPLVAVLETHVAAAMRARRSVASYRLEYDAARAKLRAASAAVTAGPVAGGNGPSAAVLAGREEAARADMERIEDEFVAAVDEAMGKMNAVVDNNGVMRSLSALVAAQLAYFAAAHAALEEVAPEIDELNVTNEAMLQPPM